VSFQTRLDVKKIRQMAYSEKDSAIVGGGALGMEAAANGEPSNGERRRGRGTTMTGLPTTRVICCDGIDSRRLLVRPGLINWARMIEW